MFPESECQLFFFSLFFNFNLGDVALLSTLMSPVVGGKMGKGPELDIYDLRGEKINFKK